MKRVIDGKMYNTDTALELASTSGGGDSVRDFHHWDETLYRTKSGAYFIEGSGGPLTSWARSTGQNSWTGGEGIRTMIEAEAREWVERWANEDYETIFGATPEA